MRVRNILFKETTKEKVLTIKDRVKITFFTNNPGINCNVGYKKFLEDELKAHGFDLERTIVPKYDELLKQTPFSQQK